MIGSFRLPVFTQIALHSIAFSFPGFQEDWKNWGVGSTSLNVHMYICLLLLGFGEERKAKVNGLTFMHPIPLKSLSV